MPGSRALRTPLTAPSADGYPGPRRRDRTGERSRFRPAAASPSRIPDAAANSPADRGDGQAQKPQAVPTVLAPLCWRKMRKAVLAMSARPRVMTLPLPMRWTRAATDCVAENVETSAPEADLSSQGRTGRVVLAGNFPNPRRSLAVGFGLPHFLLRSERRLGATYFPGAAIVNASASR